MATMGKNWKEFPWGGHENVSHFKSQNRTLVLQLISEFQNLPAPGCSQLFHFHHHCFVPPLDGYQAVTSHYETLNYFLETAFAVTCTNKLYNQSWQTQTFQHSWDLCCSSQVACLLFSLLLSRGQESTAQRPWTNWDLKTWISIPIFFTKTAHSRKINLTCLPWSKALSLYYACVIQADMSCFGEEGEGKFWILT